jgi:hypothetical protein
MKHERYALQLVRVVNELPTTVWHGLPKDTSTTPGWIDPKFAWEGEREASALSIVENETPGGNMLQVEGNAKALSVPVRVERDELVLTGGRFKTTLGPASLGWRALLPDERLGGAKNLLQKKQALEWREGVAAFRTRLGWRQVQLTAQTESTVRLWLREPFIYRIAPPPGFFSDR